MPQEEKVQEIEEILGEIENEEGWEPLEVDQVRLIYTGKKLAEALKTIPSTAYTLAMIAVKSDRFGSGILPAITRLEKLCFLLSKEVLEPILRETPYRFRAYHYGPFTEKIIDDIEFLRDRGLIEIHEEGDIEIFKLTEKGRELFEKEISKAIPEEVIREIEWLRKKYGDLELEELIRIVYTKYPEFAEKSLIKDEILPGKGTK